MSGASFGAAAAAWRSAELLIYPLLAPLLGTLLVVALASVLWPMLSGGARRRHPWSTPHRRSALNLQMDEVSHPYAQADGKGARQLLLLSSLRSGTQPRVCAVAMLRSCGAACSEARDCALSPPCN